MEAQEEPQRVPLSPAQEGGTRVSCYILQGGLCENQEPSVTNGPPCITCDMHDREGQVAS